MTLNLRSNSGFFKLLIIFSKLMYAISFVLNDIAKVIELKTSKHKPVTAPSLSRMVYLTGA